MPAAALTLPVVVQRLQTHYGVPAPPPADDPFEMILYENIAYLAPDERRIAAFELLRETVGTTPALLLEASTAALEAVTSHGILKSTSVEKLRSCAELAGDGSGQALASLVHGPVAAAKRALKRFPGIGEPGAEKILLFAAGRPFLAPESNGLRVLVRLGLVGQEATYSRTYAAAGPVADSMAGDVDGLRSAHLLLRLHGRTLCRLKSPGCSRCPLSADCAFARDATDSARRDTRPGNQSG